MKVSKKTREILTTLDAGPVPAAAAPAEEEADIPADENEEKAEQAAKPAAKARKGKPTEREYDYCVKLLLLGDSGAVYKCELLCLHSARHEFNAAWIRTGVGKTSLMMRYAEKHFSPSLMSTAG